MQDGKGPAEDLDGRRLSDLAGADRRRLVLASMLSASASILWIAQAFVLAHAVDGLLAKDARTGSLASAALAFVLLAASRIALDVLSGHIAARASERVQPSPEQAGLPPSPPRARRASGTHACG